MWSELASLAMNSLGNFGNKDDAMDQANLDRLAEESRFNRQFGPINDSLRDWLTTILTNPTDNKFLDDMMNTKREEIDRGTRPAEESAKASLLARVKANPKGMTNQAYTSSLKDMARQFGETRANAFGQGMTEMKMMPFNMGMSFLNRQSVKPVQQGWMPNYYSKNDPEMMKTFGAGLGSLYNAGKGLFSKGEYADSGEVMDAKAGLYPW